MKWFVRSSPKKQIQGIFLLLLTCCRSKILVFFKNLTNIWERIENHAVLKRSVVRHERYTYKVKCFWGEGVQKEKKFFSPYIYGHIDFWLIYLLLTLIVALPLFICLPHVTPINVHLWTMPVAVLQSSNPRLHPSLNIVNKYLDCDLNVKFENQL